MGQEAVDYRV